MKTPTPGRLRRTNGEWIELALPPLGRGGEGVVYAVCGQPALCAKLYREPDPHRAKLAAMLAAPAPVDPERARGLCSLAWPTDLLFAADEEGHARRFVGYLMPRVDLRVGESGCLSLMELSVPSARLKRWPGLSWRSLVTTAGHTAALVAALHQQGACVLGDLNMENILTSRGEGRVVILDLCSAAIREQATGRWFGCPVGRPDMLPPELLGRYLPDAERRPEQDNWSLAIAVYRLLLGVHPFAVADGESLPLESRVARGDYAGRPGRTPPPGATPLAILPQEVRQAFTDAFVAGYSEPAARPTAAEWVRVLAVLESALTRCPRLTTHVFPRHLSAQCPWCHMLERAGWDPFPVLARPEATMVPAQEPAARVAPPLVAPASARPRGCLLGWLGRSRGTPGG